MFSNDGTDKGLISKIYKQFIQLNRKIQEQNNPIKKMAEDLQTHPSQRRHINGQQAYEKMLNVVIREIQTKTIMIYGLTPVREPTIKKSRKNKCWRECRKRNPAILLVGM